MTKEKSIRLSPKHGVNPTMGVCPICNEPSGTIMLLGLIKGKERSDPGAPRYVRDDQPCDKCVEYMEQGVIFISVRDGQPESQNPYRTGKFCVVTDEGVRRIVETPELLADILKKRVAFIEDATWELIGLPTGLGED